MQSCTVVLAFVLVAAMVGLSESQTCPNATWGCIKKCLWHCGDGGSWASDDCQCDVPCGTCDEESCTNCCNKQPSPKTDCHDSCVCNQYRFNLA